MNWPPGISTPSPLCAVIAAILLVPGSSIGAPPTIAASKTSVGLAPTSHAEPAAARASEKPLPPHLPCRLKRGSRHTVSEVVDAETLRLDDSRLVRLIGALPPTPPGTHTASHWAPQEHARSALASLVLGRSVRLYYPSVSRDRYGHTLAHVVLEETPRADRSSATSQVVWVQRWLIAGGHARAYLLPGNAECIKALAEEEAAARHAGAGLWPLAAYRPVPSWSTRRLRRLVGTFQLVEGRISSVGTSRGNVYLNFGRNRRFAFTAFIPRKSLNGRHDWGGHLKDMRDFRIRVRGWIELRNGPFIQVTDPSQIEILAGKS